VKLPDPYGEVRLDTEAVFRGLWDVTGTNHPSVPGDLRYSPESGLQLRIVRHRDAIGNGLAIRGVAPIITGSIENGTRLVRLEHCWLRQSDFDCFDIFAMRALVGGADPAAFEQLAKGVTGVTFDLASVDHWLGWPRYSNDLPIDWANPGVHLASSGEQECAVASGRLAQSGGFISLNPAIKVSGVPGGRSLVAGPLVQLSFEGVKSIEEAEGAALNTVFLLNLLIGYNSRIRSLGFNVGSDTYYRLHTSKTAIPTQEPLGQPLTMATELDFPAALDAWLMLCGEAPNVINWLQSLLWKWSSLLDDENSVAAQALEGLGEHLITRSI
jgi:hypothetical protein